MASPTSIGSGHSIEHELGEGLQLEEDDEEEEEKMGGGEGGGGLEGGAMAQVRTEYIRMLALDPL